MLLSIAIVNWNTRDLLRNCLKSVYENLNGIDAEVIVVDNRSSDDSVQMVKHEFPDVKLIESPENLGFARANNLAFEAADGKYFLLLNSDTVVLENAFSKMIDFLETHTEAGAVGCRLLNGDGTLQRSCSPFPTPITELFDALYLSKLFPKSRIFGAYSMSYWDFNSVREVDFVGGSCMLLRRIALERIGLLDAGFFMYSEEADLCYRLKKACWKVYFLPDAKIIHYGGQSAKHDVNRMAVELYKSKYIFIKKHHGLIPALAYKAVVAVSSIARLAAWAPGAVISHNKKTYQSRLSIQAKLLAWTVDTK